MATDSVSAHQDNDSGIVVFDGICHLCSRSVRFILRHEADSSLRFATLQSGFGSTLMQRFGIDPADAETFILVANGRAFTKTDAIAEIATRLSGAWRSLRFLRLVPRPIRDWLYDRVARNRYRWFGRYDSCMMPSPDVRHRFIADPVTATKKGDSD